MSSVQVSKGLLKIGIDRFKKANEIEYNESYILYLNSDADLKVKSSVFWSKITLGLIKVKFKQDAFQEAKNNYGNWDFLNNPAPEFEYFHISNISKAKTIEKLMGPPDLFSNSHLITITDEHTFILDWIKPHDYSL